MMKKLFLLLGLWALPIFAQAPTFTLTGPATAVAGTTINATLTATGTTGQAISVLQWSMTLPSGVTQGTPVVSPADLTLGDVALCGPTACLLYGSQNSISDGLVTTIPITIASTTTPGNISIPVSGLVAATSQGLSVNGLVAGPAFTIKVLSPCDLNGDGVVNVTDVQLVANAIVGNTSCTVTGGCTVITLANEISASLGGICKLP